MRQGDIILVYHEGYTGLASKMQVFVAILYRECKDKLVQ